MRLIIFTVLLSTVSCLLTTVPPAHAQLEFPYPNPSDPTLQIPIDACQQDFIDWVNTAHPICYSKPTFRPNPDGDKELIKKIRRSGNGGVVVNSEELANFAHSYTNTTQDMVGTFKARPATSYWDLNNPAGFNSTCLRAGFSLDELDDCAVAVGRADLTADGQVLRNLMATSTAFDRFLSDQQLFQWYILPRAQDIVACDNGALVGPSGLPCDGCIQLTQNETSCDIARRVPDSYNAFKTLEVANPELGLKMRSLPTNMVSGLVVPAIIPTLETNEGGWNIIDYLGWLVGAYDKVFGRIDLAGLYGTAYMTQLFFQVNNSQSAGQAGLERVQNLLPTSNFTRVNSDCVDTAYRMIEQRIDQVGQACGPRLKPEQFLGSVCPDCGVATGFAWSFGLLDVFEAMNKTFQPYEIWFVLPHNLMENKHFAGVDPNSIIKGFLSLAYAQNIDDLDVPLPIDNQPGSASIAESVGTGNIRWLPCPPDSRGRRADGMCPREEEQEVGIGYTSSDTNRPSLQGAELNFPRELGQMALLSEQSPEHHPDTCYFPRIAQALPGAMGTLVGAFANSFTHSFCPAIFRSTSSTVPSGNFADIDCRNIPDSAVSVPGCMITKEAATTLATNWEGGQEGNHVQECYNDVIKSAQDAGVNPALALWVWLHESNASNYSLGYFEDFGVSYNRPEGFSAQLQGFLDRAHSYNSDHAQCSDTGVSDDLHAFALIYRSGSCDPNRPDGNGFWENLQAQWSWVAPSCPFPASPLDMP